MEGLQRETGAPTTAGSIGWGRGMPTWSYSNLVMQHTSFFNCTRACCQCAATTTTTQPAPRTWGTVLMASGWGKWDSNMERSR